MTIGTAPPLSHDRPCGVCGHANHLLLCEDHGCPCDHPPIPGITL